MVLATSRVPIMTSWERSVSFVARVWPTIPVPSTPHFMGRFSFHPLGTTTLLLRPPASWPCREREGYLHVARTTGLFVHQRTQRERMLSSPTALALRVLRSSVPFCFNGDLLGFGLLRFRNAQREPPLFTGRLDFVGVNMTGQRERTTHLSHIALTPHIPRTFRPGLFLLCSVDRD